MALTDYAAYQTAIANTAQRYSRYKSVIPFSAMITSAYKNAQDSGATPTTAANLDATTSSSLLPAIPASGTPRLAQVEVGYAVQGGGVLMIFDRLAHNGGLSGTVTTAQTCNVGPNSRWTDYTKVVAFIELYSNVGTTASTITASYTNSAGTGSRTSPVMIFGGTGFRAAQQLFAIPLQEGDLGFKSVETVTIAGTTATAGNFGVTLARLIAIIPIPLRQQNVLWDGMIGGSGNLPDVTSMYPMFVYQSPSSAGGDQIIDMRFIDA
jgi:hypothetical protein